LGDDETLVGGFHMNQVRNSVVFLMALLLLANAAFNFAWADHDEHKEKKWYQKIFDWDDGDDDDDDNDDDRKYSKHYSKRYLNPVNNPTYREECGACHFAYQPELLPSGSWEKILAGLADHNGEEIEIDQESKKIISEYLKANSAEYSSAKRAVKIMKSLRGQTPMRITDVPYIRHKHEDDDIPADAFTRKSVGSMSNCVACHTTAENGIYDDDHVVIPK
jgi:cytochrome c551/c552